ncbi:MAG: hypothetical protein GYB65_15495 [Chloroflexi bacterium]|nr:hypothetical protein [Chloroflexota bacterium]
MEIDGLEIGATLTPVPTPVGTILPDAPPRIECPRDSAWFHIPDNGQYLFQPITAQGTANIPNFANYRFEIKPANDSNAQFGIMGGDNSTAVTDGPLGLIDINGLAYGEYRLRLAVFDIERVLRASCEITIHIGPPPRPSTQQAVASATPES